MTEKKSLSIINILNENFTLILLVLAIFGFGFFAGINWVNKSKTSTTQKPVADTPTVAEEPSMPETNLEAMPEISASDHTIGSDNPKLTLVTYSDFTCGFSGRVHPTLHQLLEKYPQDIRLVYRHYLLSPTGPQRLIAEISECIAEEEGNDQFWNFIDSYYKQSAEDSAAREEQNLYAIVSELGLNQSIIEKCVTSETYTDKIDEMISGGSVAGVNGTPATIIVTQDGEREMMSGAAPFEDFEAKVLEHL